MLRQLATLACLLALQQAATFRSSADIVLVDVLVTRDNKPVEGLTAADFDIRDSGVRQKAELVSVETTPVDLLIALDVSGSVAGARLEQLKTAARAMVGTLRPIDRAMLINFHNEITQGADWTSDREQLNRAIDAFHTAGLTSLIDASFAALTLPETPGHRQILLLFTDGFDTSSWLSAASVLKMAEQARTTVYGVTVTTRVGTISPIGTVMQGGMTWDQQMDAAANRLRAHDAVMRDPIGFRSYFMNALIEDSGGELFRASDADLRAAFLNVLARVNRRYLLSYTPTGVPASGWHPLEVRMRDSSMKVSARRGYSR